MPKSMIEEALAWLEQEEKEAQRLMELSQVMGTNSETDYNEGMHEAYRFAKNKIKELLNGTN